MNANAFAAIADQVSSALKGKLIASATVESDESGHAVTLVFADGTFARITPPEPQALSCEALQ